MKIQIELSPDVVTKLGNLAIVGDLFMYDFIAKVLTDLASNATAVVPNTKNPYHTMYDLAPTMCIHYNALNKLLNGFNVYERRLGKRKSIGVGFVIYSELFTTTLLNVVIKYCNSNDLHFNITTCCVDGTLLTELNIYKL